MKKNWILVLAGLLLVPLSVQAQTIRGVVLEDETRTPIAGAYVELLAAGADRIGLVQTDSVGRFTISARRSGDFTLQLRHLGYTPSHPMDIALRAGETLEVELRMGQRAIPIEPVVVTARRRNSRLDGFYERSESRHFGRFLMRDDIERRPGASGSELLRAMPGIYLRDVGFGRNVILMRGGVGRCMPTIYLDGMLFRQYAESGVDDFLNAEVLEGVEVYTSFASAPSPIHAKGNCGVIAFWTRQGEPDGRRFSWKRLAIGVGGFALLILMSR